MSFLKIKDPSKRDKLVADYIRTKNKIHNDFRSERLGEQSMYEDFGKIFKLITEQQQKSSEEIVSKFTPLQEAIENMPAQQALLWGQDEPEALPWGQDEGQPEAFAELDTPQIELDETSLAGEYLETFSQSKGKADTTYGIRREKGKYFMGGKRVINDNDINLFVDGKRYKGTPGLWELIVMKKPKTGIYDGNYVKNYKEINRRTGVMIHPENPDRPVSNKGHKWENFVRPIWEKHVKAPKKKAKRQRKKTQGQGFLPSDPNALCEWLELMMASKQAGNTGLQNEIVSICDELLRQKILSRDAYKNLMLALNKDVNY